MLFITVALAVFLGLALPAQGNVLGHRANWAGSNITFNHVSLTSRMHMATSWNETANLVPTDIVRQHYNYYQGYGINVYDSYYGDTSFVARWYCAGGWVGVMCGIGKVQYNLDKIPSTQTNYHKAIACHEEGHGVGLAHTTNSFSCMQDPPTSSDKNYSYHDVVQHINSLY